MAIHHAACSPEDYDRARSGHLQSRRHDIVAACVERAGEGCSVLEVGCGSGALLRLLRQRFPTSRLVGIDTSDALVRHAAQTVGDDIRVVNRNIEQGAGDLGSFDVIASIDVLHHIQNRRAAIAALRSVAHPGTRWVAIEPNIWHPYVAFSQESMKRRGLEEDHFRYWEFLPLFAETGWAVKSKSYAIVVPSHFKTIPPLVQRLERVIERVPFLAGSVVYELIAV